MEKSTTHILLPFSTTCVEGILVRREKRFSVLCLVEGKEVWAHTNNSGSMLGLAKEGCKVWLSKSPNPNRKLQYTLELVDPDHRTQYNLQKLQVSPPQQSANWVGVNTLTPNRLLQKAFAAQLLPWAQGYTSFTPEAKRGKSRLDALLQGEGLPPLWVECKNVTLVEDGVAAFPDAITERGQKHVQEMMEIVATGERAAFFYCIQRNDAQCFAPASYIDAVYAQLFYQSYTQGVEVYPYHVIASPQGIALGELLSIIKTT